MTLLPLWSNITRGMLRWWMKHVRPWLLRPWHEAPRVLWDRLPHVPEVYRPR